MAKRQQTPIPGAAPCREGDPLSQPPAKVPRRSGRLSAIVAKPTYEELPDSPLKQTLSPQDSDAAEETQHLMPSDAAGDHSMLAPEADVACNVCSRRDQDELMLLCDGCDVGTHIHCLSPPLEGIPEGDWYCAACKPAPAPAPAVDQAATAPGPQEARGGADIEAKASISASEPPLPVTEEKTKSAMLPSPPKVEAGQPSSGQISMKTALQSVLAAQDEGVADAGLNISALGSDRHTTLFTLLDLEHDASTPHMRLLIRKSEAHSKAVGKACGAGPYLCHDDANWSERCLRLASMPPRPPETPAIVKKEKLTHIQHQQQCWQTLMEEVSSQAVSDLERQAARTSPALRAESLPQELVETWQPVAIASGEELNRQMAPLWVRRRCLGAQPKLTTALRNYLAAMDLEPEDATIALPGQTWQLHQQLLHSVHLPNGPGWCRVHSLSELAARAEEAASCRRMLMVCVANQCSFWENIFAPWAKDYPQVMFATLDTSIANRGDSAVLERLLGVPYVDALHLTSLIDNREVRSFNGCSRETSQIKDALLQRYHASVESGMLPKLEIGAMRSQLKVDLKAALHHMLDSLHFPPQSEYGAKMQMRVKLDRELSDEDETDAQGEEEALSGPAVYGTLQTLPLLSNAGLELAAAPSRLTRPLHPEQLRSLRWMLQRENTAEAIRMAVEYRMRAGYSLRGGVLADAVGFGKTAVCVALVASGAAMPCRKVPGRAPQLLEGLPGHAAHLIPTRATLVVVPAHILRQWEEEFLKFTGGNLTVHTVMGIDDLKELSVSRITKCDAVIVSQKLWNSAHYLKLLGITDPPQTRARPRVLARQYFDVLDGLWGVTGPTQPTSKVVRSKTPLLEKFLWGRVIVDELHELHGRPEADFAANGWREWCAVPIRHLLAGSRWGLTGTPPVYETDDIHRLGLMMQVHVGNSAPAANAFVRTFLRSSKIEAAMAPPQEHWHYIQLTAEEEALYRHCKYEQREALQRMEDKAFRALFLACSHHALGRGRQSGMRRSAKEEVDALVAAKRQQLQQSSEQEGRLAATFDAMAGNLRALRQDERDTNWELLQGRLAAASGRLEEARDALTVCRARRRAQESSLAFLEQAIAELKDGTSQRECPICLNDLSVLRPPVALEACSHVYCEPCAAQLAEQHRRCASCRAPLQPGQWRQLEVGGAPAEGGPFAAPAAPAEASLVAHGSKMGHLVACLRRIREQDPAAKCLVYCQWNELMGKVEEALRSFSVGAIKLAGSSTKVSKALERFSHPGSSDYVLICSMDRTAAGTNLQQHANHILFLHPFFDTDHRRAVQFEAQAIGRIQRQGQPKQVHVHRFVCAGTVEQELVVQGNHYEDWRQYFTLMQQRQLEPPAEAAKPGEAARGSAPQAASEPAAPAAYATTTPMEPCGF
eukprot:jgi/Tetstr1/449699/TSEL_036767.t1